MDVTDRLPDALAVLLDLDLRAHASQHVDERDPAGIEADVLDDQIRARRDERRDDEERGRRRVAGNLELERRWRAGVDAQRPVIDALNRRPECAEHALGVVATRCGLDDLGPARRLQSGEDERRLDLATGTSSSARVPTSSPPRTTSGACSPSSRPSMCAPIARSGSTTRRIGRPARDASPVRTLRKLRPARSPVSIRSVDPELPQSMTLAGSRSAAAPAPVTTTDPSAPSRTPTRAARSRHACVRHRRRAPAGRSCSRRRRTRRRGTRDARSPCLPACATARGAAAAQRARARRSPSLGEVVA